MAATTHAKSACKPSPRDRVPKESAGSSVDLKTLLLLVGRARRQHPDSAPPPPLSAFPGETTPQREPGQRYKLGAEIPGGGMARLYLAEDRNLARTVVLKTSAAGASTEDQVRFLREAHTTARLEHPNIIPIYDCGLLEPENRPFFTMKWVEGRTALDIIVRLRTPGTDRQFRRLFGSLAERINIILKAADAVAYAHDRGVIHRDLKPANLLIGDHGEVYVIDWGIAVAGAPADDRLFLGSPVHMAPEQFIQENSVDERCDVYGLGCTMYELLALHSPFDPQLPLDRLLLLKQRMEFPPLWTVAPAIRPELAEIVHRCLDPRKRNRYQSIRQLQDAIKLYAHAHIDLGRRLRNFRTRLSKVTGVPPGMIGELGRIINLLGKPA